MPYVHIKLSCKLELWRNKLLGLVINLFIYFSECSIEAIVESIIDSIMLLTQDKLGSLSTCACVGLRLGEFGVQCLQLQKKGLGLKSDYRLVRWEKKKKQEYCFLKQTNCQEIMESGFFLGIKKDRLMSYLMVLFFLEKFYEVLDF